MTKPTPPAWAKDAVPTIRGWVDAKTGELLKAQKGLVTETPSSETKKKRGPYKKRTAKDTVESTVEEQTATETEQHVEGPDAETVEEQKKPSLLGKLFGKS
jgi:hypothetical protein